MTYDIDADKYIFASGHQVYANCGIIGLGPNLALYEGYDGGFGSENTLIQADKIELATHMIEQWARFRKLVEEGKL